MFKAVRKLSIESYVIDPKAIMLSISSHNFSFFADKRCCVDCDFIAVCRISSRRGGILEGARMSQGGSWQDWEC
jgi:hypothetical protein